MNNFFYFKTEQLLPVPIDLAWFFFSSPQNLALITPPELDFKILTNLSNEEIYEGMIIDYQVRPLWGVRVHWQTEISNVIKYKFFQDKQRKGPYQYWEHKHLFLESGKNTLMKDLVIYQLPFGSIGLLTHQLLVRKKIEQIFSYRRTTINHLLSKYAIHHG